MRFTLAPALALAMLLVALANLGPAAAQSDSMPASVSFGNFKLTTGKANYPHESVAAVQNEFGSQWRVADWNDLRAAWPTYREDIKTAFSGGAAIVTWNGKAQWDNTDRTFFVEDHNGSKPGYFLAHDQLGGNEVSLGSWYIWEWGGDGLRTLAIRKTGAGTPVPAPSHPGDKTVLVALYNATGGASWTNNTNWLSDKPIGEWHGVTTNKQGRVIDLGLFENNLVGAIPAELGNLSELKVLGLGSNQLTGAIPPSLGNLSNLTLLYLWNNHLSGSIPPELGKLSNLTGLALQANDLTGGIPSELSDLSRLEHLGLWGNQLSGPLPSWLGSLSNLREIWLSQNQLTGAIPTDLGNLSNLTELKLWQNQLSGNIPAKLGDLSSLTLLELGRNQLSGEIPSALGGLSNLEKLSVSGNQLSGEIPSSLGSLSNLEQLYLRENQFSGSIPAELGSLSSLTRLYLHDNRLSGEIPSRLTSLTSLDHFHFANNDGLCAPTDADFQTWLQGISNRDDGPNCDDPTPPATECETPLTGDDVIDGSWTSDSCVSDNRASDPGDPADGAYAQYYTFTLTEQSNVTITLESTQDTFLYLLRGASKDSVTLLCANDDYGTRVGGAPCDLIASDLGSGFDSGIVASLDPGDYTIEATTYDADKTGTFTLTVSGISAAAPSFRMSIDASRDSASITSVQAGQSFDLTVRMHDVLGAGEHGGISVSFPALTAHDGSSSDTSYTSSDADSDADIDLITDDTTVANVRFYRVGDDIFHKDAPDTPQDADYLLVESDNHHWAQGDDRTLTLRITPKQPGEFKILVRGWICADEYDDCERNPAEGGVGIEEDQQGYHGREVIVNVVSQLTPEERLAHLYAPILRMHPNERFFPKGVEALAANAVLTYDRRVPDIADSVPVADVGEVTLDMLPRAGFGNDKYKRLLPENLQSTDLLTPPKYRYSLKNWYMDVPDPEPPGNTYQPQTEYPPKVYATIRDNIPEAPGKVYLQYYLFYYYDELNPGFIQAKCESWLGGISNITLFGVVGIPCGPHEADWELVQLDFEADDANDILRNERKPASVTYSQHIWGEDSAYSDIPAVKGHPIVYVGQGKHANYFGPDPDAPLNEDPWSLSHVQDHISDGGKELLPPDLSDDYAAPCPEDSENFQACTYTYELELIDEDTPWVVYQGTWGGDKKLHIGIGIGISTGIDGPDNPARWDTPHQWATLFFDYDRADVDGRGRDLAILRAAYHHWGASDADFDGLATLFPSRVTELNFSNRKNELDFSSPKTIPPSLSDLSHLQKLDVQGNGFTDVIPRQLGYLSNLHELYLNDNNLSGEIPTQLGYLSNLETLHLSGNELTGCIPDGLKNVDENDFSELGLNFCDGSTPAPPVSGDSCTTLTGNGAITGTWTSDCASVNKSGSYAQYYTFTVTEQSNVTIKLESSDEDTYLYLLDGSGKDGDSLASNDDYEAGCTASLDSSTHSCITESLAPGDYTIEATTYYADKTGDFTLTVSGIDASTQPPSFTLYKNVSAQVVEEGESFYLQVEVKEVQGAGEHGGMSVSFPTLTEDGGGEDGYSSSIAEVEVVSSTTTASNVKFYQPGEGTLSHQDGRAPFPAEHLLVESDDSSWTSSDYRLGELKITPKQSGDFPIRIRGWICADGYTNCSREPTLSDTLDQQGWYVSTLNVQVAPPADAECETTLTSDDIVSGSWTEDSCVSQNRAEEDDEIGAYAQYYIFTVTKQSNVTITLESQQDAYLYLLDGAGKDGALLAFNDDHEADCTASLDSSTHSCITESLALGTYTIEATTYLAHNTGDFTLTVSGIDADTQPPTFRMSIDPSATSVGASQYFDLEVRMHDVQGAGEHGGVSVSFPQLGQHDGRSSDTSYTSSAADVNVIAADTTVSDVRYYRPGDNIHRASDNAQISAQHLLVESDNHQWSSGDDRTLKLRIRPKQAGDFQMFIRSWICADEYTNCSRQPPDGLADQQGYIAAPLNITVTSAGAPDLVVENARVNKNSVEAGERFRFYATVRNQGTERAESTWLRYYRSSDSIIDSDEDNRIDSDPIDSLSPSETDDKDEQLDAPSDAGTYYYGACVDAVSGESDTGNNCSQGVRVEVAAAPPSLSVDSNKWVGAKVGSYFRFTVEMRLNSGEGDHGGISVSFPQLTPADTHANDTLYSSNVAEVWLNSYSQVPGAKVTFFDSTKNITYSDNTTRRANHLLVESDYSSWSSGDERKMVLWIKPKQTGYFIIRARGWICANGYSNCARAPKSSSDSDQQGWLVDERLIQVVP